MFNIKRHYCSKSPNRDLRIHPLTFMPILQTAFKIRWTTVQCLKKTSVHHLITRTVIQDISLTHRSPKWNDRQTDPRWGRPLSSYQGLGSKGGYEPDILMPLDKHINKAVWALGGLSAHIFSTKATAINRHFANMVLSRTFITAAVTLLCFTQVSKVLIWSQKAIICMLTTEKTSNLI